MPATKLNNLIYRARIALPWGVPRLEKDPRLIVQGSPLHNRSDYVRLLRRHHVLGSAALLRDPMHRVILLCSSARPAHAVTEHSLFRVASITKMAASLAALRAVDEGRLALDVPIRSFLSAQSSLPELEGVTLRHLLSHTSGLKDPENLETALNRELPFPEILPGCRASAPGEMFRYSNLGFGLIGSLLEAVYHQPVSIILRQLVFQPLGMNATLSAADLDPSAIVPITRIWPWNPGKDLILTSLGSRPITAPDPLRHYGFTSGAMYVDLPSLERLTDCLMHQGIPLLRPEIGALMAEKHAEYGSVSPTLSYGFGLLRIQDHSLSGSIILGHQGFAYGCADGAFWEEGTDRMILFLNGGCSEARTGRLGLANRDMLRWALKTEMPSWT